MCSLYPAQVMKIENEYGTIQPGTTASLVVMNEEFEVVEMIG